MKRTDPQLKLRLTSHLKEKVEAAANASGRPLSHEIIRRLEWSFEAEARGSFGDPADQEVRINSLEATVQILVDGYANLRREIVEISARIK